MSFRMAYVFTFLNNIILKSHTTRDYTQVIQQLLKNNGAGDRGRTGTVSLPLDFESSTSANSITPACTNKNYSSMNIDIIQA